MKKKLALGAGIIVVLLITFFAVKGSKSIETTDILTTVKSGPFKVEIEITGELEAKNSVKILGPTRLREFGIWQVILQNIVEEGTVVKKGDWVATLDRSEFQTKLNDKKIALDKENAAYIQTQLDTTLELREARDQLINLRYVVEEKKIIFEQSEFEPPATIKQAEINMQRAEREYLQALENYKIKKRKNAEKMKGQSAELRKVQSQYDAMTEAIQAFTIVAPEPGMVIYHKNPWDGKSVKAGSQINMWEPTVATLPDMTTMMSKTYVNEVDVRKIKPGQQVEVGLDAYPEKKLAGSVIRVANVGEQRPNSDSKVFEVSVEINGSDPTLKPSMTTSNKIITNMVDKALFIPLECLHNHYDTITYVYKRDGLTTLKQEVKVGETNANNAIILLGLAEGEKVFLSVPRAQDEKEIRMLPEMEGKRKNKEEALPVDEALPQVPVRPAANPTR
jgi:HlyD family secretion protein